MPQTLLTQKQYSQFTSNGILPEYTINSQSIPQFRGASSDTTKLFPETIDHEDLWYLYTRCDIASNAVDLYAASVWGKQWGLQVFDESGGELQDSDLEKQAYKLTKDFKLNQVFMEAHRYARAVRAGLIVLGFADGKALSDPVDSAGALKYLTVYSDMDIEDIIYNMDEQSDNYGKPEQFQLTKKLLVHASRCIHVIEKANREQPRGVSVLEPTFDLFQVLKNVDWASGEAYYQNASPLYMLSWDDTAPVDSAASEPMSPDEKTQAKTDLEDLHVKKRIIKPKSWTLEVVPGSGRIADPQVIWNPIIERIAGSVNVPKQLLLGTSAGALASGETNLAQWYSSIANYQSSQAEGYLNEFYSRLQEAGVLPMGNLAVVWPSLWEMDAKEKAEIDQIKVATATMASRSNALTGEAPVMSVAEARSQFLGLTEEVGGGSKENYQTNSPVQSDHKAFAAQLKLLVTDTVDNIYTEEEALKRAEVLINGYAEKREQDALAYLSSRVGKSLTSLPPETVQQLFIEKANYLADFKKILQDAVV